LGEKLQNYCSSSEEEDEIGKRKPVFEWFDLKEISLIIV
jgi:hypothetical protein